MLKWDDPFGGSCNDYDLLLVRSDTSEIVAGSINFQTCTQDPVEGFVFIPPASENYALFIGRFSAIQNVNFHLYLLPYPLEYQVSSGSLLEPADNPSVVAVGAVDWSSPGAIEPFSSQGPTSDNRIKPDIVAPDGVSNATFGSFFGTSASTAHVAGAAALVSQLLPCYTRVQTQTFLEDRAVDLGTAGKDNVYGSGRLDLGSLPDQDIDQVGDACDNCPSWPNTDQSLPPWPVPADDPDCDGFATNVENFVGTVPLNACPATNTPNDEDPDAWPPDFNDDRDVDITDVLAIKPHFLTSAPDPGYSARHDLNADGDVDITDVLKLKPFFLKSCT